MGRDHPLGPLEVQEGVDPQSWDLFQGKSFDQQDQTVDTGVILKE